MSNKKHTRRPMSDKTKIKISLTHKKLGIKPPLRKGCKQPGSGIKGVVTKKKNNIPLSTKEGVKKAQISLKRYWDKIGRITPISKQVKKNIKYKEWRTKVFIRDNYTCQECGEKGKKMQAHHIKQFAILLREAIKKKIDPLKYKPLWEIKNGITLCRKCHKKTDSWGNGMIKN